MDGRPNDGTRALLGATLVCHRWRRIVRNRVIKYVATFGPETETSDEANADASGAVDDADVSDTWSSSGGSPAARALSVASRPQSSGDSLSDSPVLAGVGGLAAVADGSRPRRWALRCRARVVVAAVRRNGVVPFDFRTVGAPLLLHTLCAVPPVALQRRVPDSVYAPHPFIARALVTCASVTAFMRGRATCQCPRI